MADSVSVKGPVQVDTSSQESVAYELTRLIAHNENSSDKTTRDYWLTLYTQCHRATRGFNLRDVLSKTG